MIRVNLIPSGRYQARRTRRLVRRWSAALSVNSIAAVAAVVIGSTMYPSRSPASQQELQDLHNAAESTEVASTRLRGELFELRHRIDANLAVVGQPDWSVLQALLVKTLGEEIVLYDFRLGDGQDQARGTAKPVRGERSRRRRTNRDQLPVAHVEADELVLSLKGLGLTQQAVSQFALRLEQSDLFLQVQIVDTHREAYMSMYAVAFRIDCELDASAGESP